MNWDKEDPLERGYLKAGLLRFDLQHVRQLFSKETHVEGKTDSFTIQKEAKKAEFSQFAPGQSGGTNPVHIKEEVPGFAAYKQKVTVARSAKGLWAFIYI